MPRVNFSMMESASNYPPQIDTPKRKFVLPNPDPNKRLKLNFGAPNEKLVSLANERFDQTNEMHFQERMPFKEFSILGEEQIHNESQLKRIEKQKIAIHECNPLTSFLYSKNPSSLPSWINLGVLPLPTASSNIRTLKTPHYLYVGEVKENLAHGQGRAGFYTDGIVYVGQWCKGKPHGYGKSNNNGNVYKGTWEQGVRHGHGQLIQKVSTGFQIFEGNWKNGLMHGTGKWIHTFNPIEKLPPLSITREGYWENGKLQGRVKKMFTNVENSEEEIWKDGSLLGTAEVDIQLSINRTRTDFLEYEKSINSPLISPLSFGTNPLVNTLSTCSIPISQNPSQTPRQSLDIKTKTFEERNEVLRVKKKFPDGSALFFWKNKIKNP
jgi:hypothetical protein